MLRNIIGIYPCYMGGHHLANIISTDKNFSSRIEEKNYHDMEINAHINENNLGQLHPHMMQHIQDNLEKYKSQSNVFNAHVGAFCMFKYTGLLEHFPNVKYYLIEFPQNPELDSFFRKRAFKHRDMAYYNYGYYYHEFKNHHRLEVISSIVGNKVIPIPSDIIFSPDITNLVNLLNHQLDLNLDLNFCKKLHEKWYKVVINSVNDVPEPPTFNDIITGKNSA